jgi:putative membrane-bound dehydrogenase-like protein
LTYDEPALQISNRQSSRQSSNLGFIMCFAAACMTISAIALGMSPMPPASPIAAVESAQHFQLPDDLTIQLVAAEPEVIDPVDIRWDEHGRLYVVEMRDYPTGVPGAGPLSRIKLLEDRDGDGRYETSTVFADKLPFATGVQPYANGVIVTLAGRVAFFKDTDGDSRADLEETWFTGFAEENSQLRANHSRYAYDNHIYIANGLRGGKIVDRRVNAKSREPIDISGRDFRFNPRSGEAEAVSGVGQYGLCFDDLGNRFVCENRKPLEHVVFEERELRRSKFFAPPAVMHEVAAAAEQSRLFPIAETWTTSNLHEHTFTAACGVCIDRGGSLPPPYAGAAFTCDPTANAVHAEVMEAWGPTFHSRPALKDREFLASTDPWFRPVAIENGPDGALYVVDMYRAVIEHPDWVPEELKRRPDQRGGDDRGRIYRIAAKGRGSPRLVAAGKCSHDELVKRLGHVNAWQRETAQRLLVESGDRAIVPQLEKLLVEDSPIAAFHAACTLQGLGAFTKEDRDRIIAKYPTLSHAIARLTNEPPKPTLTVEEVLKREDPWSRYELLMTSEPPFGPKALSVLRVETAAKAARHALLQDFGRLAGAWDTPSSLDTTFGSLASLFEDRDARSSVASVVLAMAEGLQHRSKRLSDVAASSESKLALSNAADYAVAAANDQREEASVRSTGLRLLGFVDTVAALEALERATEESDLKLRVVAIQTLLGTGDEPAAERLLARAKAESPAARRAILEAFVSKRARFERLIASIEAGRLTSAEIEPALATRMVAVIDPQLKPRVQKLFAPASDADQKATYERYLAALADKADAKLGREVFAKNCASCHAIGDLGVNVAPDISDSRTKTPPQLLLDILQPNRAVDGNFIAYNVTTVDGRLLTGVIASETSQALTLKAPGGMATTISRSEIEELRSTGKSLMPEGLQRTIDEAQMGQLIAFIKNWRYLDGRVPLGPK